MSAPNATERIQEKVRRIKSLPTLPQLALEVSALARREDVTMADVASKIDRDPAVSSKLLRVANSSFYGLPRLVTTTEGSILVLGLKQVQNIVLGVSVVNAFPPAQGKPTFDRDKFWQHCAGVGLLSRMIAEQMGLPTNGEEFSGGVLHDIGKIVIDQYFHEELVAAMELASKKQIPMLEAERETLGVTHAEIGGWLMHQWKLPPSLSQIAFFHHEPQAAANHKGLVALVSLADEVAKTCGLALEEKLPEAAQSHPSWELLRKEHPKAVAMDPKLVLLAIRERIETAKSKGELGWLKS